MTVPAADHPFVFGAALDIDGGSLPEPAALVDYAVALEQSGGFAYLQLIDGGGGGVDPTVVAGFLTPHTSGLGLVFPTAPAHNEPFVFARHAGTLDHSSQGRAGWSISPRLDPEVFVRYQQDGTQSAHRQRVRAREYLDVLYALWEESWEDDAVLRDQVHGRYADPAKVHFIHHTGPHYSVAGPFIGEPSPQRSPVLFTTWSGVEDLHAVGAHVEVVVIASADLGELESVGGQIDSVLSEHGRDPGSVRRTARVRPVAGPVDSAAATQIEQSRIGAFVDELRSIGISGLEILDGLDGASSAPVGQLSGRASAQGPVTLRAALFGHDRLGWAGRSRRLRRFSAQPGPGLAH